MKFINKRDILIIAVLLSLCGALALVFSSKLLDEGAYAEIYYYQDLLEVIDLSKAQEKTLSYPQAPSVVIQVTKKGEIFFKSSDCPDKICVKSGKLNKAGHTAACLPKGILIKIISSKGDNVDIIIS